ncbi:tetratricopeptide repeat protein [Micromonospora sp. NPDC051006]|uniref:tetratricopeptide repeat protein n=1 Tax=Micromonospora sp. NPDC051006 TaxID=3364283 RepID=UPI0037A62D50
MIHQLQVPGIVQFVGSNSRPVQPPASPSRRPGLAAGSGSQPRPNAAGGRTANRAAHHLPSPSPVYRRLAEANPAAYPPHLATSRNNLSVVLGEVGRRDEGLTAIEEATTLYRRLAEANPAAYPPDLAMSLNNLSADLGASGRSTRARPRSKKLATSRGSLDAPPLATAAVVLAGRPRGH